MVTMKNITGKTLLLFVVLFNFNTKAQELTFEEKFAIVDEVYARIYSAMGIREDRPQLVLDKQRARSVAYLKKTKEGGKALAVETKAFDICMSFGADKGRAALALLIGHELGHFRYNHHWGKDFASSFAMADIEEANTKLTELKFYETQADQSGGVYCYLAGYDIGGLTEPLFKKIYKEYGLPEEIPKYPSLTQRIEIANQNDSVIKSVIRVYEAGTYALMIGQYDEAKRCLDFAINKGFKSREVYNNAGVSFLLSAMDKIGKETVRYAYPVEIDVEARIRQNTKGFSKEIDAMIKRSVELFKLATDLDPDYFSGYINMACAHSLLKQYEDAEYMATKAKKIAETLVDANGISKTLVIQGIIADQKGDKSKAKSLLKEAGEKNKSYLAEANLAILDGKSIAELKWAKKMARENMREEREVETPAVAVAESIAGISDFATELAGKELEEIVMNDGSCYFMEVDNSAVYNLTTSAERELYFHKTLPNYEGATGKKVKKGDDSKMVLKKYGFPDVVFNSARETIMVYKTDHMIFLVEDGKVKSWVHYGLL